MSDSQPVGSSVGLRELSLVSDNPGVAVGWEVGGRFKREGKLVYRWPIHTDVLQESTQHHKAITLQLKINTFFLKKKKKQQFLKSS